MTSSSYIKYLLFLLLLGCFVPTKTLLAQEYIIVDSISISGHKWTRKYIIEKELDFTKGDTILLKNLTTQFEENKNRLYNTGLFNHIVFKLSDWDTEKKKALVKIDLIENWFWYPSPILELGDRSFNEWLYQHKASLKRVNIGLRFMHINLSGNADKLKFNLHTGFTNKYEVDYTFPYLNKSKTLGAYFNTMYVTHKEIAFETRNNILQFIRSEDNVLLTRFRTSLGLNYRKNKFYYHSFLLEYHKKTVSDLIYSDLNPDYFNTGKESIQHIRLKYRMTYTKVDKKIYPTQGYRYLVDLQKDGGIIFNDLDLFQVIGAYEQFFKVNSIYSIGAKVKLKTTLNSGDAVPYSHLKGLGYYDDILSGYQLYVIDGLNFGYIRSYQKIKFLDKEFNLKKNMPLRQFRILPVQLYFGIHGDLAYAREARFADFNPFNNRLLYGAGLSLDIVLYQNYFLSCELTVNHLGETGIYFNGINTFE